MEQFLEKHEIPQLTQHEVDHFNYLFNSLKITQGTDYIILKLPKKKSLDPDGFTGEYYQMFKAELTLIL